MSNDPASKSLMTRERLHTVIDQLLARDSEYRPLALLLAVHRLDRATLASHDGGELVVLEDGLQGDPERIIALLEAAAQRARQLGLSSESEARPPGQGRYFRAPAADRLMYIRWRRAEASPQSDLFFDNRFAVARARLVRHLQAAERAEAEAALAELSRADPGNDIQADAEHLVGALAWLDAPPDDDSALLERVEHDLAARARRLLGERDSQRYLARFWTGLAERREGMRHDPEQPLLSPALLRARAGDWTGVLDAIDQEQAPWRHHRLLIVELRAALRTAQRERALAALCRLCWQHPQAAEAWLELGEDDELARRVEQFWDLEPALPVGLFPAWLLARGYPLPLVEPVPEIDQARALACIRTLRRRPDDLSARQWLQDYQPALLRQWLVAH